MNESFMVESGRFAILNHMRNPELFIYRLGLVLCLIGTGFLVTAIAWFILENYFVSMLFGFPAAFLIGFGVDFIVKRSPEDLVRFVVLLLSPFGNTFYDKPFKNSDDKQPKK